MRPHPLTSPIRAAATRRAMAALGGLLLLGALGACSQESQPQQDETHQTTALADFDASSVTLERGDFCDDVSEDAVARAVGEVTSTTHYGNGDPVQLTDGVKDVSHEYNCTFEGKDRSARAWVFVPEVTQQRAKQLVGAAGQAQGCRLVDGKEFGAPGTGRICRTGPETEASYRGLFVDTWLTCSLTQRGPKVDRDELLRETGEWCVAAAGAVAEDS